MSGERMAYFDGVSYFFFMWIFGHAWTSENLNIFESVQKVKF